MSIKNAINGDNCEGYVITQGKNKGKLSRQKDVAVGVCEIAYGPRPPKYVVRHLCVNDSNVKARGEDAFVCINPAHIEWNTSSQNNLDSAHNVSASMMGKNKGKTHSPESRAKMSAAKKGKKHRPHKTHKQRSDKGGKHVISDKPRKERLDKGKKRGPYKLKTGTSNES